MLKQIEGSQAVAEAVALARPQVVCAYPITPQTHIVEGIGALVKSGKLENCEFINVESEFAALSVAIGASAVGARAYTATASQGLLFMAEAVYNAAGLGLPIVMTVGNRAIGAPINIWNDHSDSMALKDAGWIQLHAETNQEAADLHIQAFKLAEQLSCPVMVCMDGFILTHAYERVDIPQQDQVDAFLPPFEPVQQLDPEAPYSIGALVGPEAFMEVRYLAHQKQMEALEQIPPIAAEFEARFGRASGGLIRPYRSAGAETVVVALGSINGSIKDVIDSQRAAGISIGSVGIGAFRPFPLVELCDAIEGAKRVVCVEKSLAPSLGGVLASNVRMALRGRSQPVYTVIAGLGGRVITRESLAQVFERAGRDSLEDLTFLDLNWDVVHDQLARARDTRHSGPIAENLLKALNPGLVRPARGGQIMTQETAAQAVKFYQTGTFIVGNRLMDQAGRTVQASMDRSNAITSGHRACQGCGEALGARYALDAAMRAANGKLVAVNATGCLEVFTTPYPETSWQIPWLHSLFGNAPAVAAGVAAGLRRRGRDDVKVVAQGGDGGTVDIGFGCLSGLFERNDDVLYICYDNEAYMNTGVQRSSATPPAARTATTPALGDAPGNVFGTGKNLPRIAIAHDIPYVATASVADLHDLEAKVTKAMAITGARYIHIMVPCPLGWGSLAADTIKVARLAVESGLFPLIEAEHGHVTAVKEIRRRVPVEAYLRLQRRFAHLFKPIEDRARIDAIQRMADANIRSYGLLPEAAQAGENGA